MNKTEKIKDIIQRYDLTIKNRSRRIVYQRMYIFYKLYRLGFTLQEIGKIFNMNHSTILYGLKRHEMWCKKQDIIYLNTIVPLMNELEDDKAYEETLLIQVNKGRMIKTITITGIIDSKILDNLKEFMTMSEFCSNFVENVDKS